MMVARIAACGFLLGTFFVKADDAKPTGSETTERVCGACHSVDVATAHRDSREGWNAIVVDMVGRGAKGSDDELSEIVDYLTTNFSKDAAPKIAVNIVSAQELVDGLGLAPAEAVAVVRYRGEKGRFKSFEDLRKVPGLDASRLEGKRSQLAF